MHQNLREIIIFLDGGIVAGWWVVINPPLLKGDGQDAVHLNPVHPAVKRRLRSGVRGGG